MTTQVFLDGSIYSPADPFATAMVVTDQSIAWVGQDAGARSIADPTMSIQQLRGDLITPSFSQAAAPFQTPDHLRKHIKAALAAGYGQVTLFIPPQTRTTDLPQDSDLELIYYTSAREDNPGPATFGLYFTDEDLDLLHLLPQLASRGLAASGCFTTAQAQKTFLTALEQLTPLDRIRLKPRLDGLQEVEPGIIQRAKNLSVTLCFSSKINQAGKSLKEALAQGAPVALGSDPQESHTPLGWQIVADAVQAPDESAITARAAFQAMTRGVSRARGAADPTGGQLVPGAEANFARWKVEELMVQTPDHRISAWSTDPRARTPLLPALSPDLAPPTLISVHTAGKGVVYSS